MAPGIHLLSPGPQTGPQEQQDKGIAVPAHLLKISIA
jgi:hypothetical protein